ncbi:sporulation protein Cse60 [Lysinibacillus pakistanensis]|uniref:sporulation protein Cse60 n=1 Tax=Lysinibacillus pakistanensis TaxID=759811 RepID=UPI003D276890
MIKVAKVRTKILEANDIHDIENIEDKVNAYLDSLQEGTYIDLKLSTVLHNSNNIKTYTALIIYKTS